MSFQKNTDFSIVIPTYNGEKTIGPLLDNISHYIRHYTSELIIIDSSSTDRTLEIISSYKKYFSRSKIIKIKRNAFNHGKTRNRAVYESRGALICFLSQDIFPVSKKMFSYFWDDFQRSKSVICVVGKQVPYKNTPITQKLDILCWNRVMERYITSEGILVQDISSPFIELTTANSSLWYSLSNAFSCYRRSYLTKNPFDEVDYGEDYLKGKEIVEKGFIKIYDTRAVVKHSHFFNLKEHSIRLEKDFIMRDQKNVFQRLDTLLCKILLLMNSQGSMKFKTLGLFQLITDYFMKLYILFTIHLAGRPLRFRNTSK